MIFERKALIDAMSDLGDADFELALAFLRRSRIDINDESFPLEQWCLEQARQGNPQAQHCAAKFFHVGIFGSPDRSEAYRWCSRAAESGYVPALHMLAGLVEDPKESKRLFESAASLDYSPALVALATMLLDEDAPPDSISKARGYLEKAAELGDSTARIILGNLLIESDVVSETPKGLALMEAAALHGDAAAHRILSNLYANGRFGIPIDPVRSALHRQKAEAIDAARARRFRH